MKLLALVLVFALSIYPVLADEQPPFAIPDNFHRTDPPNSLDPFGYGKFAETERKLNEPKIKTDTQTPGPAIDANFKRIYQLMDQHRHENDDSSPLNLFVSSESYSQLDGYKVYVGSITVAANSAVNVSSPTWASIHYVQMTHINTSSFTCMVEQWASSFTVTNTGGAAKKIHWWLFGI